MSSILTTQLVTEQVYITHDGMIENRQEMSNTTAS